MTKTEKRQFGDKGENITERFLKKQGFRVLGRNYNKPWGEIDLIAQKDDTLHFIEVKTVSCDTKGRSVPQETQKANFLYFFDILRERYLKGTDSYKINILSSETTENGSHETNYRPEDNVHHWKMERIKRTIQTYLAEKNREQDSDWQFDVICVYLNEKDKIVEIEWLKDIIL